MHVLKILIHAARKEQSGLARCIALSALGVYLAQEFEAKSKHFYVKDAYNTLLLAIKVSKKKGGALRVAIREVEFFNGELGATDFLVRVDWRLFERALFLSI